MASVFLNVKTELDESYSDQDGAVCSDLFNPSTSKIEQEEESDNGSVFNCKDEKDEESKKKKGLEKINKDNLLEDLNKRTLEQSKADQSVRSSRTTCAILNLFLFLVSLVWNAPK